MKTLRVDIFGGDSRTSHGFERIVRTNRINVKHNIRSGLRIIRNIEYAILLRWDVRRLHCDIQRNKRHTWLQVAMRKPIQEKACHDVIITRRGRTQPSDVSLSGPKVSEMC